MKNYFFIRLTSKAFYVFLILIFGTWSSYAQFPAPYCNVDINIMDVDAITKVTFAGINRASPVTGTLSLEDFLTDIAIVDTGQSYPIAVEGTTGGNYSANVRVFIDWNQNNSFADAGEVFNIGDIVNSTGTDGKQATANITVPRNASLGVTRMRVIKLLGSGGALAQSYGCYKGAWGQGEDYRINISAPICLPPVVSVASMTAASATFNWGSATGAAAYEYVVDQSASDPAGNGTRITDTFVYTAGLAGAKYYIHVRTECSNGSYSFWTTLPFTVCPGPSNLTAANIKPVSATVGWDAVSGAAEYEYVVDLPPAPPAGSNTTKTTATTANISGLLPGTAYYLHVRTHCGLGNLSPWETHGFITPTKETDTTTSVQRVTGNEFTFSIAPNPVRDVISYAVTGAVQENSRIQILDIAGKVLYTGRVAAAKGTIDISSLANGVYLVKYSTPAGNRFIRISKQ